MLPDAPSYGIEFSQEKHTAKLGSLKILVTPKDQEFLIEVGIGTPVSTNGWAKVTLVITPHILWQLFDFLVAKNSGDLKLTYLYDVRIVSRLDGLDMSFSSLYSDDNNGQSVILSPIGRANLLKFLSSIKELYNAVSQS